MTIEFDFNKLKSLYIEALHSFDKTIAFDMEIGKGRFLFMMFLSDEDKDSKDNLFVYMRNINTIKKLKTYGNHINGSFKVYIKNDVKNSLIKELQLNPNGDRFDFLRFLDQLNAGIPSEMTQDEKIKIIRNNKEHIPKEALEKPDKTVLIGPRHLSIGTPKDKTLRKLYSHTNASAEDITELIMLLKKLNITVAWTSEENRYKAKDIREIIQELN